MTHQPSFALVVNQSDACLEGTVNNRSIGATLLVIEQFVGRRCAIGRSAVEIDCTGCLAMPDHLDSLVPGLYTKRLAQCCMAIAFPGNHFIQPITVATGVNLNDEALEFLRALRKGNHHVRASSVKIFQ